MPRPLLYVLIIPLALILLAAILLSLLLDKEKILAIAADTLEQQTGAVLEVRGDTGLSFFPTLGVSLGDASLTLPGDQQSRVEAELLEIGVKLFPLLSRRIEIGAIRVDGLDADIYPTQAEEPPTAELPGKTGKAPQEPPQPAEPGPQSPPGTAGTPASLPALTIDKSEITDSRIRLMDATGSGSTDLAIERLVARDVNTQARAMELSGRIALPQQSLGLELDGTLRLDLAGQQAFLDGLALEIQGVTPDPLAVTATGTVALADLAAELQLGLKSGGATGELSLSYSAASGKEPAKLASGGKLQGLDAGQLLAVADSELALTGKLDASWLISSTGASNEELAGAIAGPVQFGLRKGSLNGQALALNSKGGIDLKRQAAELELQLDLDKTRAEGTVVYNGLKSPLIDARLHLNLLDPTLLALAGPEAAEQAPETDDDPLNQPLPVEAIRAIDTRAELTVDKAVFNAHTVENVALQLRAMNGIIRITEFTGDVHGGRIDVKATLNAAEDKVRMNFKGGVKGVEIASLLTALETKPVLEGSADLDWQLNSAGLTPNELFQDLRGPITLSADKTVLKSVGIEKQLCAAVALVNQQRMEKQLPDRSKFHTLGVDIRMADGKATFNSIKAELAHMGLSGQGAVDLLPQEFQLEFKARLQPSLGELDPACRVNQRLTEIDWPMKCRGKLSGDPADWCKVETGEIVEDLAKNEARRKVEKEAGKALEKLFDKER